MRSFSRHNWLTPEHNRTSFQHLQSLFPTARLKRGTEPPSPLPSDHVEVGHFRFGWPNGDEHTIGQFLKDTYTDAFLILRDGVLIHEHYENGMQPDSLHLLNSISKTFLGMLAGVFVADDTIALDERVATYVPKLTGTALDQATLRQALDMTAGVTFGEDYAVATDDFWVETAVLGWRPDLADRAVTTSLKDYASDKKSAGHADGEAFHYRTLLTNIVAMAIEGATHTPVQDLMAQHLWQRLKPEYDANVVVDGAGFPYFGAGMSASARDLVRFGQMLLNNGQVDGEQVIPESWVRSTRAGSDERRAHFAVTDYAPVLPNWHYQNQTWACQADDALLCIGIFGQTVYVHQPSGIVIVKLSTHPEPANDRLYAHTFMAMRALAEGLAT